jgi:hypothetical protein
LNGRQPPKHALDAVALLVEFPVMVDLYTPVGAARNDSLYVAACEIGADGVGIIALVGEQRMSALPPKAASRCVRTMSAKGQKRTLNKPR